ncbi:hypothetical protein ACHAPG_006515 [Botrytis cinerea]
MNGIIIHKSASSLRAAHTDHSFPHFSLSRPSSDQLESNLVAGEAAVDEVSSNDSTVTTKAQIQDDPKEEPSTFESAPTEIINIILNNLLEKESPDICSALCFGSTSRRNWEILRNPDHTNYLNEYMYHIPSIIDFKYDKIPLFNPYHEQPRSFYGDGESIVYDYLYSLYFLDDPVNVNQYLKPSQQKQLMLFKKWVGPQYRPPDSLIMLYYLSCAVFGERDGKNVEEQILIKRFYDFIHYQVVSNRLPSPLRLSVWKAVFEARVDYFR